MDSIKIDFNGAEFLKGVDKVTKIVLDALEAGIFAAGEKLRDDSTDIVPFDHGFNGGLASTARTEKPKVKHNEIEVEVGYNKEYAVRLHEDMTLNISQKNTVKGQRRQQKYLEKPMRENAKQYGKIMSTHVSKALNG